LVIRPSCNNLLEALDKLHDQVNEFRADHEVDGNSIGHHKSKGVIAQNGFVSSPAAGKEGQGRIM
jgi:hypothetical protein